MRMTTIYYLLQRNDHLRNTIRGIYEFCVSAKTGQVRMDDVVGKNDYTSRDDWQHSIRTLSVNGHIRRIDNTRKQTVFDASSLVRDVDRFLEEHGWEYLEETKPERRLE